VSVAAGSAAADARRARVGAELVGRDFARRRAHRAGPGLLAPLLVGAVVAALGLAALRVQVLRTRYRLAEAMEEEARLLERQRSATVALEELRDPARLHRLAGELGLVRPERVVDVVPPPAVGAPRAPAR
jgi:hypothetical protein